MERNSWRLCNYFHEQDVPGGGGVAFYKNLEIKNVIFHEYIFNSVT